MSDLTSPAAANRVFQDVVSRLEDWMIHQELAPGSKLPPERELQSMFNTSRPTVREALRVLEQRGLVRVRPGSGGGTYLEALREDKIGENLPFLLRSGEVTIGQLYRFRQLVEPVAYELAAQQAGENDVDRMRGLLDELEAEYDPGRADTMPFFLVERRLHQAMTAMTGNPLFVWVAETAYAHLDNYLEQIPLDTTVMDHARQDWREIVNALARGDVAQVSAVSRAHLVAYSRLLRQSPAGADLGY